MNIKRVLAVIRLALSGAFFMGFVSAFIFALWAAVSSLRRGVFIYSPSALLRHSFWYFVYGARIGFVALACYSVVLGISFNGSTRLDLSPRRSVAIGAIAGALLTFLDLLAGRGVSVIEVGMCGLVGAITGLGITAVVARARIQSAASPKGVIERGWREGNGNV